MPRSEQINELVAALSKAQGQMKNPPTTRTVTIQPKEGRGYQFSYAELNAVVDAIRGPLAENGLAYSHMIDDDRGAMVLTTALFHSSGQWISSIYPLPRNADPKAFGGAVTYGKRYTLAALVGIASDEDKDAEPDLQVGPEPRVAQESRGRSTPQQNNQSKAGGRPAQAGRASNADPGQGGDRSSPTGGQPDPGSADGGQAAQKKPRTPRQQAAIDTIERRGWEPIQFASYLKASARIDSVDKLSEEQFQSLMDVVTTMTFTDAMNDLKLRQADPGPDPDPRSRQAKPAAQVKAAEPDGPSPIAKQILEKHVPQEQLPIGDAPVDPAAAVQAAPREPGSEG